MARMTSCKVGYLPDRSGESFFEFMILIDMHDNQDDTRSLQSYVERISYH